MWRTLFVACALVTTCGAAAQFYSDTTLDAQNPKARDNLQYIVERLRAVAAPPIQIGLGDVGVDTPRRSVRLKQFPIPMDFYSNPDTRQIVIPLQGIKFFSDLTIL
jgi:hypothetical protein